MLLMEVELGNIFMQIMIGEIVLFIECRMIAVHMLGAEILWEKLVIAEDFYSLKVFKINGCVLHAINKPKRYVLRKQRILPIIPILLIKFGITIIKANFSIRK